MSWQILVLGAAGMLGRPVTHCLVDKGHQVRILVRSVEKARRIFRNTVVIVGKNPPALHLFAAADFGRMVAASYDDDRALGKRLFIHGPEGITLPDGLERFVKACHPELKIMRMKLWQARFIAKLTGRKGMAFAARLIAYFDKVGELGDPTEANALLGAPFITLDEWFKMPKDSRKGLPH